MAQIRFSLAKFTTIALCALSLAVHGATETVPQFGTSAYAMITDVPTIAPDAITMSAWFKVTAEAARGRDYDCIFGSCGRNNPNGPMTIYYNNSDTVANHGVGVGGKIGSYQEFLYKKELADGNWHFVVATLSGTTFALYLDGELVGTKICTYAVAAFASNLHIGKDPAANGRYFGGLVTEAALWSKALSADEVAALWNGKERLLGNEEGLWGYWPLNEGAGTAVVDASGNNHVGTYQAAVTWASETTPFILGVPLPAYEPQVGWTGEEQLPVTETADYSVDYGEGDYTSVGQYAFTLTLKNAGAKWADKTTAPKTLPFEIVVAQNEWTEDPSISSISWKQGEDPATVTASAKYGEVVQTPAAEELAGLPIGKHTISVSVPATGNYTGLDPVAFTVYVKDPSIVEPGPDDTTATTYTWNSEKAAGLWADPVNSWTPAKGDTVHGFPANEFATATFPAGTYEVTGDENTYSIAALNINGAVTLKGGAYETAKMSMSGSSLVLDGATIRDISTGQNFFKPTVSKARIELKNGATYEVQSTRIMMNGAGMTFVANDSTVKSYWDLRAEGASSYMTNCVVNFKNLEMNAANQTLVLKGCETTWTLTTAPVMNYNGLTQIYEGGTLAKVDKNFSVAGNSSLKDVTLVLKNIDAKFGGQLNLGFNASGSCSVKNCSIVIDNATVANEGNVTRIGPTADETYMVFKGAAPKFTQSGNNQYVQSGDSNEANDKRGCKSGFKFVLPTSVYAAAPLQLTSNKSADYFYGNTTIAVDDSELGVPEATTEYPLIYAANKSFDDAFLALLNYCADLPFGATLIKSEDKHTISVRLLGADKLHEVSFLDSDKTTVLREAETVVDGKTVTGVPSEPFHDGYVFTGWSADEGVTVLLGAAVAALPITSDMTFVAQYKTSSKTAVTDPELATSAAYTGEENKPVVPENEGYTVDWGEGAWTDVGTYTVMLKLSDPEQYVWSDGTSDDKPHDFTITQAANAWVTEPTVATSWTVGETPASSLGEATFGTATMTPSDLSALAVGAYTVTFKVAETANYTGLEKTVDVKVRPQGLGPTGDPDTEDAARVYTWKSEDATGFWYDSNRWTANETPAFGYPANDFGSAVFDGANCTVAGEADDTVYTLGGFSVKDSSVTLSGGAYEVVKAPQLTGANPTLALTDGAKFALSVNEKWTVGSGARIVLDKGAELTCGTGYQNLQVKDVSDLTIAATGATVRTGFNIRNVPNFRGSFHNATFDGVMELAGGTSTSTNQLVTFSGADSDLYLAANSTVANPGMTVRFEKGVPVTIAYASSGFGPSGTDCRLEFVGDNEISVTSIYMPVGSGSTLFFGAGVTITGSGSTGGMNDFGMQRNVVNATNARTIISNATIAANNQVYMPNVSKVNKSGCGVTFMGDRPRVTVGNTNVYIGKETLAEGEVLPSWRYVLPATPYEVAPMVINATAANIKFCSNTPIEIDVSAVKQRGRYPLFTFKNAPTGVDIDALTAAMTAYKVRRVARLDASERVTLGWDEATKTIYADVTDAPGMLLLVR